MTQFIYENTSDLEKNLRGDPTKKKAITEIRLFKNLTNCEAATIDGRTVINVGRTKQLLLYSSVTDNIAHIAE